MEIIKSTGESEKFDRKKIENSLFRSGASKKAAREISLEVKSKVKSKMTTRSIQKIVARSIGSCPIARYRYNLKDALMKLGPSGYTFEEYFANILDNYDYKTLTGQKIRGQNILQEIDVVATKGTEKIMVEAKYHNSHGIRTNTKVAMYTHARFLDVSSREKNKFTKAILVTNTACTNNSIKYAKGVDLEVIGWKYPKTGNLRDLIEEKSLYPITIFNIPKDDLDKMFRAGIVMARQLSESNVNEVFDKTGINEKTIKKFLRQAREACSI